MWLNSGIHEQYPILTFAITEYIWHLKDIDIILHKSFIGSELPILCSLSLSFSHPPSPAFFPGNHDTQMLSTGRYFFQ